MRTTINIRFVFAALFALLLAVLTLPAFAQQPSSVNPTANSVREDQLLNALRPDGGGTGQVGGRVTIPDQKSATLIQPAGRDWRHFHEVTLRWIAAISILGMLILLVVFYLWRGMVKIKSGRSGRNIVRFNAFERFVHWLTATCFIILAITGLNVTFGRPLFVRSFGNEAFSTWSLWAKYAHN